MGETYAIIQVRWNMEIPTLVVIAITVEGIYYDSNAIVTTLAGQLTAGSVDGVGIAAKLTNPASFCEAPDGTIYEVEYGSHTINTTNNEVTKFAGSGSSGYQDRQGHIH